MKMFRYSLLFCLALAPSAQAGNLALQIGNYPVVAEIAATPEARAHGLMQRKYLCADCGMLFVFPAANQYGFWMKNTPLPLSIAFIAQDGRILNIEDMQADTVNVHYAAGKTLYALEMNRGWFVMRGIKPGDQVNGVRSAPAAAR